MTIEEIFRRLRRVPMTRGPHTATREQLLEVVERWGTQMSDLTKHLVDAQGRPLTGPPISVTKAVKTCPGCLEPTVKISRATRRCPRCKTEWRKLRIIND